MKALCVTICPLSAGLYSSIISLCNVLGVLVKGYDLGCEMPDSRDSFGLYVTSILVDSNQLFYFQIKSQERKTILEFVKDVGTSFLFNISTCTLHFLF